jgi:hypothetical protein
MPVSAISPLPADLSPLANIFATIFLLVPGFLSFVLARRLSRTDYKFSDFEATVISIFLSLVNYVPFAYITHLNDVTNAAAIIFEYQNLALLIVISVGIGILVGVLFQILVNKSSAAGSLWNYVFRRARKFENVYVSVFTSTGQEYLGKLKMYSTVASDEEREIFLMEPQIVIREGGLIKTKEHFGGAEKRITYAIFTSSDVKRVIFHEELYPLRRKNILRRTYEGLIYADSFALGSVLAIMGFIAIVFTLLLSSCTNLA